MMEGHKQPYDMSLFEGTQLLCNIKFVYRMYMKLWFRKFKGEK